MFSFVSRWRYEESRRLGHKSSVRDGLGVLDVSGCEGSVSLSLVPLVYHDIDWIAAGYVFPVWPFVDSKIAIVLPRGCVSTLPKVGFLMPVSRRTPSSWLVPAVPANRWIENLSKQDTSLCDLEKGLVLLEFGQRLLRCVFPRTTLVDFGGRFVGIRLELDVYEGTLRVVPAMRVGIVWLPHFGRPAYEQTFLLLHKKHKLDLWWRVPLTSRISSVVYRILTWSIAWDSSSIAEQPDGILSSRSLG